MYEKFLEKVNEGIAYADTIRPTNELDISQLRPFQDKMMVWVRDNLSEDLLSGAIVERGQREILKRVMALSCEGKSLEDSLL